ncbi:hypothetical protein HNQ02_000354 [Flavobacterium sp. 7E]|uniref:hypothetical protein n=1 Tax=Flavobacterium sp. 7E TaxID=2735898 RepID=UPI0015712431|nr:hypothetical protein [Flavobacterium sp. 7E]NRS87454.1 hypothetical protein [Flavobacterium sp. 7E]
MKYIKYIGALLLVVLIFKCIGSSTKEEVNKENVDSIESIEETTDNWYTGGNLHKAKISEWKVATEENKLATCADFMAIIQKDSRISDLKIKSIEMKNCIDEATRGLPSTDNMKTSEIASLCAVQLGY